MAERAGFEPAVALGDTRSPGVPDRPLQHLSANQADYNGGEGGIRTRAPLEVETAFRERHHEPLGHLSWDNVNLQPARTDIVDIDCFRSVILS